MKSDMETLQIEQRNITIKKAKEHGLTIAQYNKLLSAYRYLKTENEPDSEFPYGRWFDPTAKREISRGPYEWAGSLDKRYVSAKALKLKGTKKTICWDHCIPPQMFAYYICDNWKTFKDFVAFVGAWKTMSTVIGVTSEENGELSKESVNNEETGNVLKVKVPVGKRYHKCGIKLWDKIENKFLKKGEFPVPLTEHFNSYERTNLMNWDGVDSNYAK
jgi:hypothetical protein